MKQIILILLLFYCSCDREQQTSYYNGYKYWVFISEDFTPKYSMIHEGDIFSSKKNFNSKQIENFGTMSIYWNGAIASTITSKASHYLVTNDEHLMIEGNLTKDLRILIFESVDRDNLKVIEKRELKKGAIKFEFEFK